MEIIRSLLPKAPSRYSHIENDEVKATDEMLDALANVFKIDKETRTSPDATVHFNNCQQAFYKDNTVHNYAISEELKQLYEDKINLLLEKTPWLEKVK